MSTNKQRRDMAYCLPPICLVRRPCIFPDHTYLQDGLLVQIPFDAAKMSGRWRSEPRSYSSSTLDFDSAQSSIMDRLGEPVDHSTESPDC